MSVYDYIYQIIMIMNITINNTNSIRPFNLQCLEK